MKAMLQRLSLLLALVLGTAWGANDQLVPINNGMNTLKIFGTNFKVFRACGDLLFQQQRHVGVGADI